MSIYIPDMNHTWVESPVDDFSQFDRRPLIDIDGYLRDIVPPVKSLTKYGIDRLYKETYMLNMLTMEYELQVIYVYAVCDCGCREERKLLKVLIQPAGITTVFPKH
jgi:hypothetical protein